MLRGAGKRSQEDATSACAATAVAPAAATPGGDELPLISVRKLLVYTLTRDAHVSDSALLEGLASGVSRFPRGDFCRCSERLLHQPFNHAVLEQVVHVLPL